jgi:hypothetical protein
MWRVLLLVVLAAFIDRGPALRASWWSFLISLAGSRQLSTAIWPGRIPVYPR